MTKDMLPTLGAVSDQHLLNLMLSTSSLDKAIPHDTIHPSPVHPSPVHPSPVHPSLATAILEQATDAIEICDLQFRLVYVNLAFEKITGYQREEALGQTPDALLRVEPYEAAYEDILHTIASGQAWTGFCTGKRKDGSTYHQDATVFPIYDGMGEVTNYVAIKRDIGDRQRTQSELEQALSLLQATLESTVDGILVISKAGKIEGFNQKFVEMWGIAAAPAAISTATSTAKCMVQHGNIPHNSMPLNSLPLDSIPLNTILDQLQDPNTFFSSEGFSSVEDASDSSTTTYEDVLKLKDGRIFERYSLPQCLNGKSVGRVWSFRDVTLRHSNEAIIRYQASHDLLTGLPNRMLFNDRLATTLEQARQNKTQLAVMFLDLDHFKNINDTLGHAAGDLLLQNVAERLTQCLRESDIVARWAGDEFTLLLPNIHDIQDATAIAQRILESLREEFDLAGHRLHISISIGIAAYPQDGEDTETLLKNADTALYRAKATGRNRYHLYSKLSICCHRASCFLFPNAEQS